MSTETRLIYKKIADVMRDLEAIGKDRKNTAQGYAFRGIDDVYNALHPLLAKHGVFTVPEVLEDRTEERTTKSGTALIYRVLKIKFTFYAEDGSSVFAVVIGEGMDSGDKASNKAMAVGHKYALVQVFAIPTVDAKDPENDSPIVAPKRQGAITTPQRPAPKEDVLEIPFGSSGPEAVYSALPSQKKILSEAAKRHGYTHPVHLGQISEGVRGTLVNHIDAAVKEWLEEHRSELT